MPKVKGNIRSRNSTRRIQKEVADEEKEEKLIVPYLDNDIAANILSRIPADLLRKNFMYQSKDWSGILSVPNFIHANSIHAKPGLIFATRELNSEDNMVVGFLELEGFKPKVRHLNVFKVHIRFMSSCNGLVLVEEGHWRFHTLSILNPTTKESIRIPPCKHQCLWHELVYLSATKEYKLVDMFRKGSKDTLVFHVRSIGGCRNESYCVMPFRDIMVYGYNSLSAGGCLGNERIVVDGVVYVNFGEQKLLFFDVCNELVQLLELPSLGETVKLTELNGSVSFLDCIGTYDENCPLDVWVLKDLHTGKWEKKYRIDTFPEQPVGSWYHVLGCLDGGRVIVFEGRGEIFVYDVNTRQWNIQTTDLLGDGYLTICPRVHVNSLAQIRG